MNHPQFLLPHGAEFRRAPVLLALSVFAAALVFPPAGLAVEGLTDPAGYWATTAPPFSFDHATVLVPRRDLLVVIVGVDGSTSHVWALPLAHGDSWIELDGSGPLLGTGLVAAYDAARDRILVHGGRSSDGSTWELRVDPVVTWSRLLPGGEGPGARWNHSASFDAERNRLLVHGGTNGAVVFSDTWELRLQGGNPSWRPVRAAGLAPPPRAGHAAVIDAARSRLIVLGGTAGGPFRLHALSLRGRSSWSTIDAPDGPLELSEHTAVLDEANDRILVYGGQDIGVNFHAWSFDLGGGGWTLLEPQGPIAPGRFAHVAAFDARRVRMVVTGGGGPVASGQETWALDVAAAPRWRRLAPAFESPPSSYGDVLTLRTMFDPNRNQLMALVGRLNVPVGETWALSFAPDPHWRRMFDAPTRDVDGYFDATRDRAVIFGGFGGAGTLNTLWELSPGAALPRWNVIPTGATSPPAPRMDHVVAHDPNRDRLLVFGGADLPMACGISVDSYGFGFGATAPGWASIGAIPAPEGGWFPVGIVDPLRDRFLVHGGLFACRFPGGHPSGRAADGTWALDLAAPVGWRRLATPDEGPGQLLDAVYDPPGRRMIGLQFGLGLASFGLDAGNEHWSISDPRGMALSSGVPHAIDYDAARDRFVILSGEGIVWFYLPTRTIGANAVRTIDEMPALRLAATATWGEPARLAISSRGSARGTIALTVTVPEGPSANLQVFDVRGRMMSARDLAAGTRGNVDLETKTWAAGIYFARLRQAEAVRVEKVVLIR